ncbi:hypothetical protein OIU84_027431 [Salix udensis]|uniref:Reverse transcriptase zinc-binding domain-containing protein n=1 Tax=Salix udensis TaxID=889485 RepID=A0AAD6KFC8_9ROSI|nr:hypothetical protein OIU84_027431 [Salix udensis]
MLWLAAQGRLRTLDRLPATSIDDQNCKLCTNLPESHDHLFFSCSFSSQVWKLIQDRSHKQWPALPWNGLLDWTARRYKDARSIDDFIGPLIFAGTVYHVWQERNSRIFRSNAKSVCNVVDGIFQQIRDLLMNNGGPAISEQIQTIWNLSQIA